MILVTGALGHIGSALIKELPESILLDNLSTQRYPSLFGSKHTFIEGDIRDADLSFMKDVDVVIHLAAKTDATSSVEQPYEYHDVNVHGVRHIAEACMKYDCKLIFPSTTSVNDKSTNNHYAISKRDAEEVLKYMNFPYVILRFGTIFGPSIGMRFHTAVNKFIWQAVHDQPITVWKTAMDQVRPYLALSDCIYSINKVIDDDLFDGTTYNIVTGNYTVKEVVETIKDFIPSLKVKYVDSPIMNQTSYHVASNFVKMEGNLRNSIRETIDLFYEA